MLRIKQLYINSIPTKSLLSEIISINLVFKYVSVVIFLALYLSIVVPKLIKRKKRTVRFQKGDSKDQRRIYSVEIQM